MPKKIKKSEAFESKVGLVVDPIVALKRTVNIKAGNSVDFNLVISVNEEKEVAINKLNKLMSIDSAHKSEYNWCVAELKKPITLKDNGRGQYTACINKLNAIK